MANEIWSDLDQRMITDGQGNIKRVVNVDAVINSISNILNTEKGSRCMLPQFGGVLGSIMFDNINSSMRTSIAEAMKAEIEKWDDRPTVTNIDFYSDPDRNLVTFVIGFTIKGYDNIFTYKQTVNTGG